MMKVSRYYVTKDPNGNYIYPSNEAPKSYKVAEKEKSTAELIEEAQKLFKTKPIATEKKSKRDLDIERRAKKISETYGRKLSFRVFDALDNY